MQFSYLIGMDAFDVLRDSASHARHRAPWLDAPHHALLPRKARRPPFPSHWKSESSLSVHGVKMPRIAIPLPHSFGEAKRPVNPSSKNVRKTDHRHDARAQSRAIQPEKQIPGGHHMLLNLSFQSNCGIDLVARPVIE